jgi:hydrogenase expression/formation protein HypE
MLAFTTDSYVIDPVFFPGGNIGKLAVCGTVNDLAVSGAIPEYISASFIIEEGLPFRDLEAIVISMAEEALNAGVRIITGDTKVVEKGKCDKIFITTSGTGVLPESNVSISTGRELKSGDRLIINGPLGNHAIAVLGARNKIDFTTPVVSDCASMNRLIRMVMDECSEIHFMRDITRGGLAAVLNELAGMTMTGIEVDESAIPVDDPVRGICEIMGFDPLNLANEGKLLMVAGESESERVLGIMRSHPLGINSAIIGSISGGYRNRVVLRTSAGGRRILDVPEGGQLPRIC